MGKRSVTFDAAAGHTGLAFPLDDMNAKHTLSLSLAAAVALASVSCNRSGVTLGRVSGQVTLDGKPLAGARVIFRPTAGGRMSQAITDPQGNFSLAYTATEVGALVGEHSISIETGDVSIDNKTKEFVRKKEVLPAKYNWKTTLSHEVKRGQNSADFALSSRD